MPPPPPSDIRTTGLSLALAALACSTQPQRQPDGTSPASGGEASQPAERYCKVGDLVAAGSPTAELAAFELRHDDFARRTLYSWTTPDQVRELREDPTLLTRAATAEG